MPGEDDDLNKDDKNTPDIDAIKKSVEGLPTKIQEGFLAAMRAGNAEQQAQMAALLEQTAPGDKGKQSAPSVSEEDLEKMDRPQLVAHMTKLFQQNMESLKGDLEKGNMETRLEMAKKDLREEGTRMRGEHPDFDDYKSEILALAKRYPDLGPKELYVLARHDDPDKGKETRENAAKENRKAEENSPEKTTFAGFMPTGSFGTEGRRDMTPKDAAETAWAATMAALPKELVGTD